MDTRRRPPISLEFDDDDEPIAGRVVDGAQETPFVGWLELTVALERARRPNDPDREDPNAAEVDDE